ncbi:hypothetical protein AcV5_008739 [Taiwanofungus camphoratus]|nr:hypothetical protein AcV5_008739 [Antrodia cinnamomea]
MPTVPPTYRPISFADEGLLVTPVSDNISDDTSGPTPDPELDDIVLVSAESGDAVTSAYSDQPPAHSDPYIKPHFCLGELNLHSPSSIVGTPFDLSPRFEYPFPTPPALPEPEIPLSTSLPSFSPSVFSLGVPAIGPSLPLAPLPRTRANPRGYSPTHPKLHPREPPMPPGLAKKCRIASVASPTAYPRSRGGSLPSFHLQALDPPSSPRCAHPLAEPRSSTLNCKVNDGSSDAHLNLPRANVVQSVEDAPHSASHPRP